MGVALVVLLPLLTYTKVGNPILAQHSSSLLLLLLFSQLTTLYSYTCHVKMRASEAQTSRFAYLSNECQQPSKGAPLACMIKISSSTSQSFSNMIKVWNGTMMPKEKYFCIVYIKQFYSRPLYQSRNTTKCNALMVAEKEIPIITA